MFIPEFWCGVIATIGFEIVGFIGLCVIVKLKNKTNVKKK